MYQKLLFCILLSPLVACTHALSPTKPVMTPATYYDYALYSPLSQPLSIPELTQLASSADVILVGEWHSHAGIHRFQTQLLQQLAKQDRQVALSMEQFSRDKQVLVDSYLQGKIGEQPLIVQANAWPNYESDYRPLVELAKAQQLDVIAANAPRNIVRCIGRQGLAYLDTLATEERAWIAEEVNIQSSAYKDKFIRSMHHGEPAQNENQYAAQVSWDETMAESILRYLKQHPKAQVMHIAGKFHVEQGLGIKASIERRAPNLKVMVITPVTQVSTNSNDYQLHVLPPPARYIQQQNRIKAYHAMMHRGATNICK